MKENAVKQRVRLLEGLWETEIRNPNNKNAILCCMRGTGIIDYRMVKGFVYVQMTDESILPDVFLFSAFPFKNENQYGIKLVEASAMFIEEWNKNNTPKISWAIDPFNSDVHLDDALYFAQHMITLAESLEVNEQEETLVITFMPEPAFNPKEFVNWLVRTTQYLSKISQKVRLLVYDNYGSGLYDEASKILGDRFLYLYPDLDMPGAVGQIAEEMQANASEPEKKDLATFQNNLLKLTKAIGTNSSKDFLVHRAECLKIANSRHWDDMSAITHFFCHTFHQAQEDMPMAEKEIAKAIAITEQSIDASKKEEKLPVLLHYLIAQANMYLIAKKLDVSLLSYEKALSIANQTPQTNAIVINGLHQMLGRNYYEVGQPQKAFDTLAKGWYTASEQIPDFVTSDLAKFYIGDMVNYHMDSKEEYRDIFHGISQKLGNNWHQLIPQKSEDYKLISLQKTTTEFPVG
ncbi:MAG: hypothetical protein DI598_04050 [Pseudopedobacter saltans]|uniref:Uncharacterized protein n=1 Tax=Pseudopedobacter saltans TaxID=151895 RepID=A0A2W5FBR6_9SPHI|nr:MAG: hypothetical protein DI598_04050 [Pseudopedobacter saltans]